jgi:hypothetical protein
MVLRVDGRQGPNNNEYQSHIKFIANSFSRNGQINVRFSEWRQDLQVMAIVVAQVEGKFMNMVIGGEWCRLKKGTYIMLLELRVTV